MATEDLPIDLYIAAYSDADAAAADWADIKQLAKDKLITVDALVLVKRDADGKIHIKEDAHEAGLGAAIGGVGGAVIGLIFPPTVLGAALVGAGIGAATGAVVDQVQKRQVKAELERTLPPNSSAIVAVVEERWVADVEKALTKAEKTEKHHLHDGDEAAEAPADETATPTS